MIDVHLPVSDSQKIKIIFNCIAFLLFLNFFLFCFLAFLLLAFSFAFLFLLLFTVVNKIEFLYYFFDRLLYRLNFFFLLLFFFRRVYDYWFTIFGNQTFSIGWVYFWKTRIETSLLERLWYLEILEIFIVVVWLGLGLRLGLWLRFLLFDRFGERWKYLHFRFFGDINILLYKIFLLNLITSLRLILLSIVSLFRKLTVGRRRIFLLEANNISFKNSSHIFRVDLLEIGDMFDIFIDFLNYILRFLSCLKLHKMFFELISGEVVVFEDKGVAMHDSHSFGKYLLGIEVVWHY